MACNIGINITKNWPHDSFFLSCGVLQDNQTNDQNFIFTYFDWPHR